MAGLWRGLALLVLTAGLAVAQPALAQEGPGPENVHAAPGPASGAAGMGAPRHGLTDPASPGPGGEPQDGGAIGLIEAPEEAGAMRAESALPDLGFGTVEHSSDLPAFAERRAVPGHDRLIGPIDHPPVVVELFTSQGCSSCPPADEMLNDLAQRDDILALSWHVDYWDYLGWADVFARPEFTLRQQAYAHAWGERAVYTPQMVVGGSETLIAVRPAELMALIEAQMALPAPMLVTSTPQADGYQIELTPRGQARGRIAILLIRYLPERQTHIRAGENRGMDVTYRNVVLAVEQIGEWDGRVPLRMTVTAEGPADDAFPPETRHAILAQEADPEDGAHAAGPILAAVRLD